MWEQLVCSVKALGRARTTARSHGLSVRVLHPAAPWVPVRAGQAVGGGTRAACSRMMEAEPPTRAGLRPDTGASPGMVSACLSFLSSEEVCKRGFTVIVDMRGSKWDSIKPLLKILQESFPCCIHVALIIKPDNFWQKQRTNFGSSKFEFEVTSLCSQTNSTSRCGLLKAFLSSLQAAYRCFKTMYPQKLPALVTHDV